MDSATEHGIVMRASRILAVLTLLIAPPSAFGQQAQQDVSPPLDAACAFSADERWRPPMVETTVATFGRLDAAYNNAGVQNVVAEAAEATREDFDRVMSINLRGVWSCTKFELRQMLKQGSGAIVNCSSIGGLVGGPRRGTYPASKHGVLGLTKSAALEYAARGIRINAVCPGIIHISMLDRMMTTQADALNAMPKDVPIARLGRPEEIASAVLWLCSSAASFGWVHRTLKTGVRLIDQEADVNIEQRHYVQMAEIEIDPAQFEPYRAAVTETAVRVKPGVLVLYAFLKRIAPRA